MRLTNDKRFHFTDAVIAVLITANVACLSWVGNQLWDLNDRVTMIDAYILARFHVDLRMGEHLNELRSFTIE